MRDVRMIPVLIVVIPQRALNTNKFAFAEIFGYKVRSLSPCNAGDEVGIVFASLLVFILPVCGYGKAA